MSVSMQTTVQITNIKHTQPQINITPYYNGTRSKFKHLNITGTPISNLANNTIQFDMQEQTILNFMRTS